MEAVNDKSIRTKIDFEGQGSSFSDWSFREDNNKSTQVTWAMDLDHLIYPVGRIMGLVMQSMLKKSFENGLSKLNNVSQNYLKQLSYFKTSEIKIKQTEKQYALVIKDSSKCDEIESLFGKLYMEIGQYMGKNKIESAGAPIARYFVWDEKANKCVVEAGFFIKNQVNGSGTIRCIEIPAEKAISAIHYGPYETLHNTHEAINDYIIRNKLNCKDIPIEIYITDPETQPDMTKWETEIDYPLK
jgi:effector-binding domain-containing protein